MASESYEGWALGDATPTLVPVPADPSGVPLGDCHAPLDLGLLDKVDESLADLLVGRTRSPKSRVPRHFKSFVSTQKAEYEKLVSNVNVRLRVDVAALGARLVLIFCMVGGLVPPTMQLIGPHWGPSFSLSPLLILLLLLFLLALLSCHPWVQPWICRRWIKR